MLKESLADDSPLDLVEITGTKLVRVRGAIPPQPHWWTEVAFEADAERAGEIAQRFAPALKPAVWYLHFWTDGHISVVFRTRVFTYRKGDDTARDEAIAYGLSVGVPRHQLTAHGTVAPDGSYDVEPRSAALKAWWRDMVLVESQRLPRR